MTKNEFIAQKALGIFIDLQKAAKETKSAYVLLQILKDHSLDMRTYLTVAQNIHANIKVLTEIIVDRKVTDGVLSTCIYHPVVTRKILESWAERSYINELPAYKSRMNAFRILDGEDPLICTTYSPYTSSTKLGESTTRWVETSGSFSVGHTTYPYGGIKYITTGGTL